MSIIGLVEEFILPFVMDQTRLQLEADDYQVRSLLRFAEEEARLRGKKAWNVAIHLHGLRVSAV
jgi:hypothetical protein